MIPFVAGIQKYYCRTKRDGQSSLGRLFTDSSIKSYFNFDEGKARFHGVLDIETLGGAGFASQRTTGEDREYDLSEFAGIQLEVAKGDSM